MSNKIALLILKELRIELRRKSVISAIFLYLLSLTFICYLSFNLRVNTISPNTWAALYWLTILFSVITTTAKSFIGERSGISLYYYTLARAGEIITAKIIYNWLLLFIVSISGYIAFSLYIYNPIADVSTFLTTLLFTCFGFSASLTLISAIASKASHSNILMAVLSFPIIISILLMAIRITKNIIDGLERSSSYDELLNLVAINCIVTALAYVLFPYIWRS